MTSEQTNAIFELLEAFPDLETQLFDLFGAYVFGEITGTEYERRTRKICVDRVMTCILTVKQGVKSSTDLINAYFDVARYQTDVLDAAIEWGVDKELLELVLRKKAPSKTPEDRLQLIVPSEVVKRREL